MKKTIALLLSLLVLLAGCGSQVPENAQVEITRATAAPAEDPAFCLTFQGCPLIPGRAFDPADLPQADSVFQAPSCAIEGTDNVYSYGSLEVTAFDDGSGEVIYSVYLIDAPTDEGLSVGDAEDRIPEIYGQDFRKSDHEYLYTRGATQLRILVQDGRVLSIELLAAD